MLLESEAKKQGKLLSANWISDRKNNADFWKSFGVFFLVVAFNFNYLTNIHSTWTLSSKRFQPSWWWKGWKWRNHKQECCQVVMLCLSLVDDTRKDHVLSSCYDTFIFVILLWVNLDPTGYSRTAKWKITFRDQPLALMPSSISWCTSPCLGTDPGRTDLSWKVGKSCLVLCWAGCSQADVQQGKVLELTS